MTLSNLLFLLLKAKLILAGALPQQLMVEWLEEEEEQRNLTPLRKRDSWPPGGSEFQTGEREKTSSIVAQALRRLTGYQY